MNRHSEIQAFADAIRELASDYHGGAIENLSVDSETEVDLVAYRLAVTLFGQPGATSKALVRAVFSVAFRFGRKNFAGALVYLATRTDAHLRHVSGEKLTLGVAVVGPDPEMPS